MRTSLFSVLFVFLLLLANTNVAAQEKISTALSTTLQTALNTSGSTSIFPSLIELERVQANGRTSLTLEIENDSLLLKRDDGFYTSGNHLIVSKALVMPQQTISYAWHVGQDLYTASDIKLQPQQLNPKDHPYAGWLYAGVYRDVQNKDGSGFRLGLDVGCLGPCAGGEWTQTHLHRLLNQPLPQAWSTQLKQEWGAVLSAEVSPARWQLSSEVDVTSRFKVRAGNIFSDAKAELTWRYGILNDVREAAGNFIFARAEVKAVAYNASLQGGYFNDQHLMVSPQRLVPEIELGYQYRGDTWGFYASVLRRGSEIKELPASKAAQNFAKLQVIYSM